MRSRVLSALIFVAVIRLFPSHREIMAFLRHLFGLFALALLVSCVGSRGDQRDKDRSSSSPIGNASYLVHAPVSHHDRRDLTAKQRRRLVIDAQQVEGMPVVGVSR